MKSLFLGFIIILLVIRNLKCTHFTCEILNPLKMKIGSKIYVPANSTAPFPIHANFSCTYVFHVPKDSFLRLSVINSLLDRDFIEFADSVGYVRNLTASNIVNEELFATAGYGHVKVGTGPQGRSEALLVFEWVKMPSSTWTQNLHKNQSGFNVDCMTIQANPITFTAVDPGEKVALSIAHSGYILDHFDSYFIFDGNDTDSQVVGRMTNHITVPFIPTNQSVTVIGLTKQVVYSNVMANIQSNIGIYRKYESAVVIDQHGGQLDAINQTIAVTLIAKDGNELYITSLRFNEIENQFCELKILSGTPSPISKELLSYTPSSPLDISFPQQFPASQFTTVLTDCSVYMVVTKNMPKNFYTIPNERMGYFFTPSFLDDQLGSNMNITLDSNQTRHFSTTVESVKVYGDENLIINVMNSKGYSAMSVVVTGNQTGGSAVGIGTSVNINFCGTNGHGQAKIRYHISQISGQNFSAFFSLFFFFVISFFVFDFY